MRAYCASPGDGRAWSAFVVLVGTRVQRLLDGRQAEEDAEEEGCRRQHDEANRAADEVPF